jgi:hypothetical protein
VSCGKDDWISGGRQRLTYGQKSRKTKIVSQANEDDEETRRMNNSSDGNGYEDDQSEKSKLSIRMGTAEVRALFNVGSIEPA